jgi:hypothetical protein
MLIYVCKYWIHFTINLSQVVLCASSLIRVSSWIIETLDIGNSWWLRIMFSASCGLREMQLPEGSSLETSKFRLCFPSIDVSLSIRSCHIIIKSLLTVRDNMTNICTVCLINKTTITIIMIRIIIIVKLFKRIAYIYIIFNFKILIKNS